MDPQSHRVGDAGLDWSFGGAIDFVACQGSPIWLVLLQISQMGTSAGLSSPQTFSSKLFLPAHVCTAKMSRRSARSTRGEDDFSTRMETYLRTITALDKNLLIKHLDFVQSDPTTHDRDTLMRFLDTDAAPQREPVSTVLPVDELHERLERIAAIEDHLRELMPATWEPSIFHFASLLLAPIGHLRQLANDPILINTLDLDNVLVPQLIRLCMYTDVWEYIIC